MLSAFLVAKIARKLFWYIQNISFSPNHFCITADIDECSADSRPCGENADCTNSEGSYSCTCKQGFTGDGAVCEGTYCNVQYNMCDIV